MKCAEFIRFREEGLTSGTVICIEHDDRQTTSPLSITGMQLLLSLVAVVRVLD